MEHVYEKIINLDSESQTSGSAGEKPSEQKEEEDMAVLAEEKIELLCQDQVKPIVAFTNCSWCSWVYPNWKNLKRDPSPNLI